MSINGVESEAVYRSMLAIYTHHQYIHIETRNSIAYFKALWAFANRQLEKKKKKMKIGNRQRNTRIIFQLYIFSTLREHVSNKVVQPTVCMSTVANKRNAGKRHPINELDAVQLEIIAR